MLTELEQRADTEARHAHRELVEELEAKLAKAVEALALYSCEDGCNECPESERDRVSCGWTACRTLAELKGRPKPVTDTTPEAVERLARKNETRTWTRPHAPLMTITEPEPLGVETADALRTLLRERDEARASVAAAYEAAADVLLDRGTNVDDPIAVRKDILALITDDAQTALTKMLAEARAEGMREAAALLSDNVEKRGPNEYRRGRQGYSNGIDACYAAILAAADAIRNREKSDE